ncbi:MAG TPA: ABC transporter permease [Vicinamibacterales bacterium]|nr:ABC transporter permease [Vicinamibacterales bacterium]
MFRSISIGCLRQLWRYRLRSALLIVCGALGVAGVIVSVNFAAGGRRLVLDQIQRMGTNVVMVTALQDRARAGRTRTGSIVTTLRLSDYDAIRRDVTDVVRASPVASTSLRLKAGEFSKVTTVVGCQPSYFSIKAWPVESGAMFDDMDLRRSARVAVIGQTVAGDLYGTDSPLGHRILINRVPFTVVGIMSERGQGLDIADEDRQVFVPLSTLLRRLVNIDFFNAIVLEIRDWNEMDRTAAAVSNVMRVTHHVSGRRAADFQVQSQKELVDTQLTSSARLGFLVRWVGWSGLLVAALGTLAMTWIAVRDRTTEIGTRRAVGATATDIFAQFAFEAFVLAACGSICGLGFGWSGTQLVATRSHLPFIFDEGAATLAAAMALAVNISFAAWPAYLAARLDPVAALKKE